QPTRDFVSGRGGAGVASEAQCGGRAAAGRAGAAYDPECLLVRWACHVCRAGFAGRGTAPAHCTRRHTLASPVSTRDEVSGRNYTLVMTVGPVGTSEGAAGSTVTKSLEIGAV